MPSRKIALSLSEQVVSTNSWKDIGNMWKILTFPTGNEDGARCKPRSEPAATSGISGKFSQKYLSEVNASGHSWISSKNISSWPLGTIEVSLTNSSSRMIRFVSRSPEKILCNLRFDWKLNSWTFVNFVAPNSLREYVLPICLAPRTIKGFRSNWWSQWSRWKFMDRFITTWYYL